MCENIYERFLEETPSFYKIENFLLIKSKSHISVLQVPSAGQHITKAVRSGGNENISAKVFK